jgi:hypothetical protein
MSLPKLKEFLSTHPMSVVEVNCILTFVSYVEVEFQPLLYCNEYLGCLNLVNVSHNFQWTKREQLAFDYVCWELCLIFK